MRMPRDGFRPGRASQGGAPAAARPGDDGAAVPYEQRWRALRPARPREAGDVATTMLALVDAAVRRTPHGVACHYLGTARTWAQVDRDADALASLLRSRGFRPGERLALCLQNDPAFLVGLVAAWRLGGIAAAISPMAKHDELEQLLLDYEPTALLILDGPYAGVARTLLADGHTAVRTVVTVPQPGGHFAGAGPEAGAGPLDAIAYSAVLDRRPGPRPRRGRAPGRDDVAVILPTSGTTGFPRGAKITHGNLLFAARTYRDWFRLERGRPVLALSPVFHVTGLVGALGTALVLGAPLVLTHRFDPAAVLDAIAVHRPGFAVASITAYIALADHPGVTPAALEPLEVACSGGAPVLPAVAQRVRRALGTQIHTVYGLTESTSPATMAPPGREVPVDLETGVASVGVPVFDTVVRVVDETGAPVGPHVVGELVVSGPQVISGYWKQHRPNPLGPGGRVFRTGDVGFMDAEGWVYVLDRSNDIINASGYKVWPYEVESVLVAHPAVCEAAVVPIPDDYRGESVKAFVALESGARVTEQELITYCRERLSAYKYPREVELVGALPRTATGKVMRRSLLRR
ncbi:class I adenylate-forming enzyme family protein [Patulibacter sp. S7RM1-6]